MSPARPPHWPRPGQDLALAAPAGSFPRPEMEAGLEALGRLIPQKRLRLDAPVLAKEGYLAGDDRLRAAHLAKLFADPGVGAVLGVRGGVGSSRLLPLLDLPSLSASRTLFIGFSDLSCLLNALAGAGLMAVHGPVITQLPRLDQKSLAEFGALIGGAPPWPATLRGEPLAPGSAQGPLMGGNLTMLCHLMGTAYFPRLEGAVLCLEETGEAAFRIDRLLTQLELAGVLGQVAGIALGELGAKPDIQRQAGEVAARRLGGLGVPVVSGLPFGHGSQNRCLPMGARARIDGNAGSLQVGLDLA